ncbi:MAG TPA: beta-ketoacyl synthase chain length factor [Pseudomonadales bacterium]|nr:beta-ketoacyl synthase chain length factor [Pseudomonadales bacterium]
MKITASLLGWSAWTPGISTPEEWQAWADGTRPIAAAPDSPPVDFIPAMQRRRLSRLSRLSLAAAYSCAGEKHNLPTVFASRHGEIHRTFGLLSDLAQNEPLSPMAFSLSVHNTASGLYSIATGNTAPSTAIAAGLDTLPMALIEAIGQLQRHEEVMVVYAEEPLPDAYKAFAGNDYSALLGLALRLGRPGTGRDWQLQSSSTPVDTTSNTGGSSGLALLRWLNSSTQDMLLQGERNHWQCSWL